MYLSLQGIVGLASYAYMLRVKGDTNASDYYDGLNKNFVQYWIQHANVRAFCCRIIKQIKLFSSSA